MINNCRFSSPFAQFMDDPHHNQRFGGIARLFGRPELARFQSSRVAIVGIGGVGSWAVEALARSGIGTLILVDMDEVCVTNTNRQVHALQNSVGLSKTEAMAKRIHEISPSCKVEPQEYFLTPKTLETFLETRPDIIIDAIDSCSNKCMLIAHCRKNKIPLITTGGAGGRRDPTQVQVADLSRVINDPLAAKTRKELRKHYHFPREKRRKFGIPCVFSPEAPIYPSADGGTCCVRDPNTELKLDCESGFGTASFLTGTFGFVAASEALKHLAARP